MSDQYEKVLHLYNLQYHIEILDFFQYYQMKFYMENPNNLKRKTNIQQKEYILIYLNIPIAHL